MIMTTKMTMTTFTTSNMAMMVLIPLPACWWWSPPERHQPLSVSLPESHSVQQPYASARPQSLWHHPAWTHPPGQQEQNISMLCNHFKLVLDNRNKAALYCIIILTWFWTTTTEHLCTVQSFQTGSGQQQSIPVLHNHFNLVLDNNNRASLYCAMFQLGPGNKNKESLYCAILSTKSWTIRPEHLHIVQSFQFGPG